MELKEKWSEFKPKWNKWWKSFFFSFIWLGILMLVLDLVSKQCVVHFQDNIKAAGTNGVDLIPGFLAVNYLVNTNMIFGRSFIQDKNVTRIIYIVVAILLSAGLIAYYVISRKKTGKFVKACIMLILSGAIGNLIDRIFYTKEFLNYIDPNTGKYVENGVVDWINFYGIWKFNFNWADSCLVVGCIMLIVWLIVTEIIDYTKKKKKEPKVAPVKQLSKDEIAKLEQETGEKVLSKDKKPEEGKNE